MNAQARLFMDVMFSTALDTAGQSMLVWRASDKISHFFQDTSKAAANALAAPDNCYFGLGLQARKPGVSGERGKVEEITGICSLWCDIDFVGPAHKKKNVPPDLATAEKILSRIGLAPSVIVSSGFGIHVYWLLTEPWIFNDAEDKAKAMNLSEAWGRTVKACAKAEGYDVDMVFDITRVLRLPGTKNVKGKHPVDVAVIRPLPFDEASTVRLLRYNPEDFEAFLMAPEHTVEQKAVAMEQVGAIILDPAAEPPRGKLEALIVNDRAFKKTWERNRTDFQDQSPSAYDMGLSAIAVQSGWSDQEIANLLIASRRKHKDDLKLRRDYYQRTIGKARTEHGGMASINNAILNAPPPARATTNETPTITADKRKDLLADISKGLGINMAKWIQHGHTRARFSVVLADGRDLSIGSVAILFNQASFRQRIYEETGIVIKSFKQDKWHSICQILSSVAEMVENTEMDRDCRLKGWLEQYTSRSPVYPDWDRHKALHSNEPFVKGDKLYIHASSLLGFVRQQLFEKVEKEDLLDDLRAFGFASGTIGARIPGRGRTVTRTYWSGPAKGIDALVGIVGAKQPAARDESEEGLPQETDHAPDNIPI